MLLNLQLGSTPASPSNPTLQEDCALSVLLLQSVVQQPPHTVLGAFVGHTTHCLSCEQPLAVQFPELSGAWYKAKQGLCCLWGKDNEKKDPEVIFPAPLVELLQRFEVYCILGCFFICFNLQLAYLGILGWRSLLLEVPILFGGMPLKCPFMEEREAGTCRAVPSQTLCSIPGLMQRLAQSYQWQSSTSAGQRGPATHPVPGEP